jgi:hypothetical protein
MANLERTERLADLLGVGGGGIRWGRALAFLAALLISDLVPICVRISFESSSSLPWEWFFQAMVVGFVIAACAAPMFLLLRSEVAAAFVSAAIYTVLMVPIDWLIFSRLKSPLTEVLLRWPWMHAYRFAWVLLFLIGLSLAVRWVKPVWLALGLGAATGMLVLQGLAAVRTALAPRQWESLTLKDEVISVLVNLGSAALLSVVFWAGLQAADAKKGRLSKPFFLWSAIWGLGLADAWLAFALREPSSWERSSQAAQLVTLALALMATIYVAVVMLILFHRMWDTIQDGHARTTPGQAVGFLFIPLFNFYWAFQAIWGFARDYNRFVERHWLNVAKLPAGLFLTYVILSFTTWVPVVGVLTLVANYFIGLIMVSKICDAVNAVPESLRLSYAQPLPV